MLSIVASATTSQMEDRFMDKYKLSSLCQDRINCLRLCNTTHCLRNHSRYEGFSLLDYYKQYKAQL